MTVRVPLSPAEPAGSGPVQLAGARVAAELATELIRSLPKPVRRNFAPAPEFARRSLDWLAGHPAGRPGVPAAALGRALRILTGEPVEPADWDPASVPDHLRVGLRRPPGRAPDAETLAAGQDLAALQSELAPRLSRRWPLPLPRVTRPGRPAGSSARCRPGRDGGGGAHVVGYPALVDEGTTVGLSVLETPDRQAPATAPVCAGWCCSARPTRRSGWCPT